MAYFFLNRAVYGGYLDRPAADFKTTSGRACWFPVRVQKAENKFGYINAMCYSDRLIQTADEYMISANIGRRLVVSGETIFPPNAAKAVMLKLSDITFIDDFVCREEAERQKENMADFSDT